MKRKGESILIMVLATMILVACSKDTENPIPEIAIGPPLPKVISLVYSSGETVAYTLAYNKDQQLMGIDILRKSSDKETHLVAEMIYNEAALVAGACVEDLDGEFEANTTFAYAENGDIVDVALFLSDTQWITSLYHDPDNRIYGINGDLGNFPMGWQFDEGYNLVDMSLTSNLLRLSYSDSEKGVFHQLDPQPALAIWHGLLFYLSSYELYFFHQQDLELLETNNFSLSYEDKVRNQDGELIAFKMVSDVPGELTIDYTIQYENP